LLQDASFSRIYCLTRRKSPFESILRSLADRNLFTTLAQKSRIIALASAIDQPKFGLDDHTIYCMQETVTHIIHAAWPVNFNLPFSQFFPHIQGVHNLLQLSLSVHRPEPAVMLFCSSVSTALATPSTTISEEPMTLSDAYMGYGRSKLVGEHIVSVARRAGGRCYSLRIGQVSGHSKKGLWNDTEAIPLMIRSALTLKALPDLDQICSWLPVDNLAATIVEIGRACLSSTTSSAADQGKAQGAGGMDSDTSTDRRLVDDSIYNVCNSREFSWSAVLESLSRSGFQFETVPFEKWISMLRESEARGEEHVNPAVKLIGHYEAMYGKDSSLRSKRFHTNRAERDSETLRNGRLRMIEDGILNCYARDWLSRWMTS
jgi:thioester reductase-like protein